MGWRQDKMGKIGWKEISKGFESPATPTREGHSRLIEAAWEDGLERVVQLVEQTKLQNAEVMVWGSSPHPLTKYFTQKSYGY